MDEKELKQYLSDLVLEFATKMNEIETDIYLKSEEDEDDEKDWFEEFKSVFMVEIPAALAALRNIQGLNLHTKQKLSLKMSVKQKLSLRQKLKNLVIQDIYSLLSKRKTAGKLTVIKDGVTGRKSG